MFRHLSRLGHSLTTNPNLRYGNKLLVLSRHFSNELTADWPQAIKSFLEKEKITSPTLIQEKTLPIALKNQDIVGIARTGSGKTLAFVIPAVMKILSDRENQTESKKPSCLILAPTRELASQTFDVFRKFTKMNVRSLVLVGGSSRVAQLNSLEDDEYDVYIATPGRLLDLLQDRRIDLSHIKYLVLDEADRMLDMGFEPQIRRIVASLPKERQTLMWSATWPKEIKDLAEEFMKDYEQIAVDSEKLKANPNIRQLVEFCSPYEKLENLLKYLDQFKQEVGTARVLIFVNTKRMADSLLVQLMKHRHRAISMHGDRSQRQRDDALRLFKNQQCNIMIATDVAARGLDISDITHVINYDFPNTIEDYIHRIGRTARHDKSGSSLSFVTPNEAKIAKKLVNVLKETDQGIPDQLVELSKMNYSSDTTDDRRRRRRDDFYSTGGRQDNFNSGGGRRDYRNYDQRDRRSNRNSFIRSVDDEEDYDDDDDDDNDDGNRYQNHGRRSSFRDRY